MVSSDRFEDDKKRLNLEKNDEGVYICKGRLQGFYPIYLPQDSVLGKKLIFSEQERSLNGGVAMTMSNVRSSFWIPHSVKYSGSRDKTSIFLTSFWWKLEYHKT